MRRAFADASFFVMLLLQSERRHDEAIRLQREMETWTLVTSVEMLMEVLAFISRYDPRTRLQGVELVRRILSGNSQFELVYATEERLQAAVDLYAQRLDQSYSLADCLSMTLMDELGITEVLTYDSDFHGEGRFTILPPAE